MSWSRVFSSRIGLVMFAAFALASIGSPLWAQVGGSPHFVKFKEPVASRVYQRDANGRAEIPIVLDDKVQPEHFDARISGGNMNGPGIKLADGKFVGVPVGGPYTITCSVNLGPGKGTMTTSASPVLVGDIWVLAGQSNMEGVGDLIDVTPPNPRVMLLGMDPYCNLADGSDMAVPVFGPITLDEHSSPAPAAAAAAAAQPSAAPIKVLIITGDNVSAHKWQENSKAVEDILEKDDRIKVDITASPSKDLTDENLARYDVLLLNYKETPAGPPESRWSDSNKAAFLKSVREGKGLVAYHFASSAFTKPNWDEFEKAVAGGWRTQGFHGPAHVFSVKKTGTKHPISDGLPAEFEHTIDELYQNSMMLPGSVVLATAYSDPKKPRGTGKDEPVVWVSSFGKGRVYENVLGHDIKAMADPKYQDWLRRGVIWAGTGKVD
jgi:type 1 glutamine amidotransferase